MYVRGMLSGDYLTAASGICIPRGLTVGSKVNISAGSHWKLREY